MSDVTHLLDAAADGELLPLVYAELRSLAATRMAVEGPNHTLDATALGYEAYLQSARRARQRESTRAQMLDERKLARLPLFRFESAPPHRE